MGQLQSNLDYKTMCFFYKIRDLFNPPINMLKETDIKPGYYVLDFGCGPGGYSIAASKMTGNRGRVYALDIHPLAIKKVKYAAQKEKLNNLEAIQSDGKTGLPDSSMDIILMYDVYLDLGNRSQVLEEIYRVLKPEGVLSFSDHHLEKEKILSELTKKGLFKLKKEGKKTYSFEKIYPV